MNLEEIKICISWYEEGLASIKEFNNRLHNILDPPWIPIKNNQPIKNQFVLIAYNEQVIIAQYKNIWENKDLSQYDSEELEDVDLNEMEFLAGSSYLIGVTHWMPLPKLPKE